MKKKFLPLLFIFILGIYSYFVEPNLLQINRYVIQDTELSGLKIIFASDFHIKPNQEKRLKKIVKLINTEEPDLVLSAGDFVAGHNAEMSMPIENIAKELGKIKSKYGFFTTLGNHDGWHNAILITETLRANGIKVLANANTSIITNNNQIFIAGVEDLTTGTPDIQKALKDTASPTILITHSPDIFPNVPQNVNLTLAGHTHGGQIRIPFIGAVVTASDYGNKYTLGLIKENNKKMITTKGIGTSILPIRFNCMPEIVLIEFE